jgi:hypothetical protein
MKLINDLEKIVISYVDPVIFKYMMQRDPKNYSKENYMDFLSRLALREYFSKYM